MNLHTDKNIYVKGGKIKQGLQYLCILTWLNVCVTTEELSV